MDVESGEVTGDVLPGGAVLAGEGDLPAGRLGRARAVGGEQGGERARETAAVRRRRRARIGACSFAVGEGFPGAPSGTSRTGADDADGSTGVLLEALREPPGAVILITTP
ncbi:hypothetical protein [Streptomyces sp. ALB3]|uniref:hypothetical protein n=1 Tax=Streptomyces sp. ALB3 TaxID=3374278 RepID=UPI0037AB4911